ncbi:hypothetical protein HNQ60_000059 [Povalibacter uvarum]|uniref:beta-N-acetylhexosaminidase n=1 Tax=Povalibacter uvarum TaxID=732238 RepID=A0A841HEV1_9GAMM|nr:glycoside hydrolase family 20 zincin-like fold domain-containing protein [Povalibacter uvarum]MBB6091213.1 hypothetical protein [Povalibacter uvarum]
MTSPRSASIVGLLFFCARFAAANTTPSLLPLPTSVRVEEAELVLSGRWDVRRDGCDGPVLDRAFSRFEADYERSTGIVAAAGQDVAVSIRCSNPAAAINATQDESYALKISLDGIRIDAAGSAGVLRALATLRQLVSLRSGRPTLPLALIGDAPRFACGASCSTPRVTFSRSGPSSDRLMPWSASN